MRAIPSTTFSSAEGRAAGWSDSALSRAAGSGRLARVRRGHYAAPGRDGDPTVAAVAAAANCLGSVVSHRSAALLHGLPLLAAPPSRPDITVAPHGTGDEHAALLHRATLWPEDIVELGGVPVTSIARTLVDLGRTVSTAEAVMAIDAALYRTLTNRQAIDDVRLRCARWPGIRRLVAIMALADGRAESPLESYSRLVFRSLRLPRPEPQAWLYGTNGILLGRSDFYWDEFGVAGEADGRSKYEDRDVLTSEKERQEELENPGLVVVRWGWADVNSRRPRLHQRILAGFERGRRRDQSGFPRGWSWVAQPE